MRWLGLILRFAFRSFSRAIMGCFFACFRVRDNRHLPTAAAATTTAVPSRCNKPNDVVVPRNRLSSLFLSEEKEENACDDGEDFDEGSRREAKELRDEAKFLKACGTLASTPAEIRKASQKLKQSPSCDKDSGPTKFCSWLLDDDTSAERIQSNAQPFNPPTPTKRCEELEKGMDSSDHTPSSCISNAQNTQWDSHDSEEGSTAGTLCPSNKHNKSVRFECDTDISSCGSSDYGGWHLKKTDSPNPTPMKLSDEMQTPGTVYPATSKYLRNGKPLVKSQFVYPNSSPGEDVSKTKILEEEEYTPEKGLKKMSYENESKVEASLSSWLKPASVILEEKRKRMEIAYDQIRKTPADRPIIGLVAAHWNEEENSDAPPPKWWDGNGIPNSTNKYKEDQKVSWHATPFEERLEKALSEDTLISQRKDVCGKPIAFDENEESDTALSQLKPSTHSQSVMSF